MLPRSLVRMVTQPARQVFGRSFSSGHETNGAYLALKSRIAGRKVEALKTAAEIAKDDAERERLRLELIERKNQLKAIQTAMFEHHSGAHLTDKEFEAKISDDVNDAEKELQYVVQETEHMKQQFAAQSRTKVDETIKSIDPNAPTSAEIDESFRVLLQHQHPIDADHSHEEYEAVTPPNPEFQSEFIEGVMPGTSRQSNLVGTQREEYEFDLAGLGGFNEEPSTGPFGTLEEPVLVFSSFSSRVAGCKGGHDLKHRLLFFTLYEGKKHVCLQCGQAFKLITPENIEENDAVIRKAMSYNRAMLTDYVPTAEEAKELLKPEVDYGTYKL